MKHQSITGNTNRSKTILAQIIQTALHEGIKTNSGQYSGYSRTISSNPFLIVGSPPVNLIFVTPFCTNKRAKRITSSSVEM
jgi:hypothetical protein